MTGIVTQTIETERLILRKLEKSDAFMMLINFASNPNCDRYTTWKTFKSLDEVEKYLEFIQNRYENDSAFHWGIVNKNNNQLIGEILTPSISKESNTVEIGYRLSENYWNRGYTTEALKAVIEYLFNQTSISRVFATYFSTNVASGKVMEKAGMHYQATRKDNLVDKITGEKCDEIFYSIDK